MDKRPKCKYGAHCYRKNPQHMEEFDHSLNEKNEEVKKTRGSKRSAEPEEPSEPAKPPTSKKVKEKSKTDINATKDDSKQPTLLAFVKTKSKVVSNTEESEEDKDEQEERWTPKNVTLTMKVAKTKTDQQPAVCRSVQEVKDVCKSLLLMDMPQDFYDFWQFASERNPTDPLNVFRDEAGLQLVGPYELFTTPDLATTSWPCHWRFYYDPPEVCTVLRVTDGSQLHLGYFRDDPKEMPVFVVSNNADVNGQLTPRGENLFSAVKFHLEDMNKKLKKPSISALIESISEYAQKRKYDLEKKTKKMKERDRRVVTKTFHGAGLVVPVDDNEVGYRELPHSPAELRALLDKISKSSSEVDRDRAMDPLMETVMLIQFANDECDYGEGIELGLDLFTHGDPGFHSQILSLLPLGYQFINRQEFADIIKSHLHERKKQLT